MLTELLTRTAWSMTPPKPYGAFHLAFFFSGLAVSILLAFLLRKTNEKQNRAVLLAEGIFLLVSEIYKQLFYTFVLGGGRYQWWIFPFQLCSIPMYLCLIAPWLKPGRIQNAMYDFMVSYNLLGGFVAFLEPSGLVHEYWTLTLHAFFWHMSLVFLGIYLGFSGRAARKLSDFRHTVLLFLGICLIAFFINLCLSDVSGGDINMFYVGPAISPIIVFKQIATNYGWFVNTPIFLFALTLGGFLFFLPFALVHRKSGQRCKEEPSVEKKLATTRKI